MSIITPAFVAVSDYLATHEGDECAHAGCTATGTVVLRVHLDGDPAPQLVLFCHPHADHWMNVDVVVHPDDASPGS